ncbi:MAG: hypothetical protein ACON4U_21770 [Myxococcota bacterium]
MPAIPFKVIASILRVPDDLAEHPHKAKGVHFYSTSRRVVQDLLSFIILNETVSKALNQSLLKLIYTQQRQSFQNLPFDGSDLLIEVFTLKMNSAERNCGLACPVYWHSCSDEVWFNWLKVTLQNQLRDLLRSSKNQAKDSLDSPVFDDAAVLGIDLVIDENSNRDHMEEIEINSMLRYAQRLEQSVAIHSTKIVDFRRLCWLLLKAPELVREDHFLNANKQFFRTAHKAYLEWTLHYDSYLERYDNDDPQQVKCRSFLTWLLFGPEYKCEQDFINESRKRFNSCRDNLRQNVTRATADIHFQILPLWIWLQHEPVYQPLLAQFLKQSLFNSQIKAGLPAQIRTQFEEEKVLNNLLIMQQEHTGQAVNEIGIRQFVSVIHSPFCRLVDRQLPDNGFEKKTRKIIKLFRHTITCLPEELSNKVSIDLP